MITLFFVGIIEMVIVTAWTKLVTKAEVLASGLVTIVNILIWYYVLERVVKDLDNFTLIIVYAIGCAIGTMIGTYAEKFDKKARQRLGKRFKKLHLEPQG